MLIKKLRKNFKRVNNFSYWETLFCLISNTFFIISIRPTYSSNANTWISPLLFERKCPRMLWFNLHTVPLHLCTRPGPSTFLHGQTGRYPPRPHPHLKSYWQLMAASRGENGHFLQLCTHQWVVLAPVNSTIITCAWCKQLQLSKWKKSHESSKETS